MLRPGIRQPIETFIDTFAETETTSSERPRAQSTDATLAMPPPLAADAWLHLNFVLHDYDDFFQAEFAVPLPGLFSFTVSGLGGNDTIYGYVNSDDLYGDDGNDYLNGNGGNDYLDGGAGNDVLVGNGTLYGGAGSDLLAAGAGAAWLDGGDGFDIVTYELASAGVGIFLNDPKWNTGAAAGHNYSSIEEFILSSYDDNFGGSDAAADVVYGRGGNDYLGGLGGLA